MTNTIKVEVYCGSLYDLDNMSIVELQSWVNLVSGKIPDPYRHESCVSVDCCDGYGSLKICYWRPESFEEGQRRRMVQDALDPKREAERCEYEEYQRLKAKYEKPA